MLGLAPSLLTEIDPGDEDAAFGLCDRGLGCPEVGYVSLAELAIVRRRLGLRGERDRHFEVDKPLSAYAIEAHAAGRVEHLIWRSIVADTGGLANSQ